MAFRFVSMGAKVVENPEAAAKELTAQMAKSGSNMGVVAKAYGVHRETLAAWFDRLEAAGFPIAGRGAAKKGRKPGSKNAVPEVRPVRGRVRRASATVPS